MPAQTVTAGNRVFPFAVRPDWKTRLVNGWDAIDITQSYGEAISKFLERDAGERPWARPRTP